MTTEVRTPPHHNTITCYCNYHCRLPECVERYRTWHNQRQAAQRNGQWQTHVDANPVRQHLQLLASHGITLHRAAELAGIGTRSLHPLFQPKQGRRRIIRHTVRAELAAKVLAIDPDAVKGAYTNPTGTARRIQALVAIGWPMSYLAADLGLGPAYVSALLQRSDQSRPIRTTTADNVTAAYERLKDRRPSGRDVTAKIAQRTRKMAASRRWAPPAYWADRLDLIDDPTFEPQYGIPRSEVIAEEGRWLMTAGGLSANQAAARLGVSRFYLDRSLREHPPRDEQAAA